MTINTLTGIKPPKFFIPVLRIIFSILSLGYLFFSSLLLQFAMIIGAFFLGSDLSMLLLFVIVTVLSFLTVVMLPLQLKWATFFFCLLLIAISIIQVFLSNRFEGMPNAAVFSNSQFDTVITGVSFGLLIAICAKIYLYWLTLEGSRFYISRQTIIVSVLAGITISLITSIQISSPEFIQGNVSIHGIIVGCIAVIALLLNNKPKYSLSLNSEERTFNNDV